MSRVINEENTYLARTRAELRYLLKRLTNQVSQINGSLIINEIILDECGTIDGNASINIAKNIIKWKFYHTFGINFLTN